MAETKTGGSWLPLTFYMEKHIVRGVINQPDELRLTDFLNQVSEKQSSGTRTFIEVNDTNIVHEDGGEESQPSAYLNSEAILLVTTEEGDLARGIGAAIGPKKYPFVQKSSVQVVAETSAYALSGNMHCSAGQVVGDVLRTPATFLPLTDVQIKPHGQNIWLAAPFAALNKGRILSLAKEKVFT